MNMTLSKRGDYVVRSALALARAYPTGKQRKIREVVAEMGVPQTFASQILSDLVRAGIARSKAGKDGGYRLARPPEQIPLVEVVEAGEGPLRAERCALGDGPCRWESVCPLHETWTTATDALREVLATATLADLANRDVALEEGRLVAPADSHRHASPSVPVDDFVQVEAACAVIGSCLGREHLVSEAVASAYQQADELRRSLFPGGTPWFPVDLSTSCSPGSRAVPPSAANGGAPADDPCVAMSLSFEGTGHREESSHGDLELVATSLDPARTELRAIGKLRLPPLPLAPEHDEISRRLAQVMVRTLLRRLAQEIEGQAGTPDPTRHARSGGAAPVTTGVQPASELRH